MYNAQCTIVKQIQAKTTTFAKHQKSQKMLYNKQHILWFIYELVAIEWRWNEMEVKALRSLLLWTTFASLPSQQ